MHLTRNTICPLLCLVGVIALAGCSRVVSTPFIQQAPLVDQGSFQPHFNKIYRAPEAASMKGRTLLVKVLDPRRTLIADVSKIGDSVDWDVWRINFEDYLADQLWQSMVFSDVSATSDTRVLEHPDLTLEVAISRWDEGADWPRFLIGFGVGATHVQWEGSLTDNTTGEMLLGFADARLHPGGSAAAMFGFSLKALHGDALIAEDLRNASRDLVREARLATGTADPPRRAYDTHPKTRSLAVQEGCLPSCNQSSSQKELLRD